MKRIIFILLMNAFLPLNATCVDNTLLDTLMKRYVSEEGLVDYRGIDRSDRETLSKYLSQLKNAQIDLCSQTEQMAFWINAYNASVIQLILDRPQLKKVSEDFSLFDEKIHLANRDVTLNIIENRILRSDPKKGGPIPGLSLGKLDPRIHFALVCAAVDCPRLRNRAYESLSLDSVLNENAKYFANNSRHLRIENKDLIVSSLMKWYESDFKGYGGVVAYLSSLTDSSLRVDADQIDLALKKDFPSKTTFVYDWTLNIQSAETREGAMLKEGDAAPNFSLLNDGGTNVSLVDLKGKTVVLYFYPKDDTPGCTKEACDFRDNKKSVQKKNVIILGVSADSVEAHVKFKKKYDLPFALLSDPDKKVIQAYGVWKEKSMYGKKFMGIERTTFIIGPDGKIKKIFPKVSVTGHVDEVLNSID